ncbi:glycosyltransferase family 2 protein [Vibrio breoganii]
MIFSIILCVHEFHPYLSESIKSILEQDFDDYEVIVVANNCSDELFSYLEEVCAGDNVVLRRTHIGQLCFNLNYAINIARGDYIIRMDSDDVCYTDRLKICYGYISLDYDIVAFSADYIDESGLIIGERILTEGDLCRKLIIKNPIIHPAAMIKRSFLLKMRGYSGGFQSEDYDLWLRASRDKNLRYKFSEQKVIQYRISDGQSKGNLLPYCETSGYYMRELTLKFKFKHLLGLVISVFKRYLFGLNGFKK